MGRKLMRQETDVKIAIVIGRKMVSFETPAVSSFKGRPPTKQSNAEANLCTHACRVKLEFLWIPSKTLIPTLLLYLHFRQDLAFKN